MKLGYRLLSLLVILSLTAFIPAASANHPATPPSHDLIVPESGFHPGPSLLSTIYSADFESGEGFALGVLEGQQGFAASGTNLPWASVANANPASGAQHMRLIFDQTSSFGTQEVVFTPTWIAVANSPSTTTMKVYISNDQGADYDVVGQAPSQGFLSWRVKFHYSDAAGFGPGTIFVLDDPGSGLAFYDTGVTWTPGSYRDLKVEFDPANNAVRIYYDNAPIYTATVYAGTAVEQLVWVTDNFQLSQEVADFDAVLVTDTATPPVPTQSVTWSRLKTMHQ